MPVRAVRSPERICAAVDVMDLMGLASFVDTSTPMMQASMTATMPAVATAPYELLRNAASPLVMSASLPKAQSFTVPITVPSASFTSCDTTASALAGTTLELALPPLSASPCSTVWLPVLRAQVSS